ncbi:MAG: stage 0 sporulation protein [Chloroflexi bacterium]|nr:MAG: stage 0 sporulation protein [Chloroflexota bacterium]
MPQIVGVRFKPVTKIYYFNPNGIEDLEPEKRVIVETARGTEMGVVVQPVHDVPASEIKGKLKKVVRTATPVDLIEAQRYKALEPEAQEKAAALARELKVPIKVLAVDYSFDGSRLIVSFTAEQRVDFRDLAKQLARALKTRIEMKQVGARDETKILDGYGRCGRRLCCSSWLTEFHPVSIRMAKNQGLPLAPAEISGLCGRLLCCLAYENQQYSEIKETLPTIGSTIKTSEGVTGWVKGLNVIKETLLVQAGEEEPPFEIAAQEIEVLEMAPKNRRRRKNKKR